MTRAIRNVSFVVFALAVWFMPSTSVQAQTCWGYIDTKCGEPENVDVTPFGFFYGVNHGCDGECAAFRYCCADICIETYAQQPTLNDCNNSEPDIDGACVCA
jgi:hypothetical protein